METKKVKINTLIISDTHLGDNNARCPEILQVLRKYQFARLILNGDILDGLKFQRFHSAHWQILSEFRERSKTCEVIWIHGNHDAAASILSHLLGVKVYNKYLWEEGNKKFLAIHGHQFDRFLHNNAIISYLAFALYSLIKRYDKTEYFVNIIRSRNKAWRRNSLAVARRALKLGKSLGVDYIFCGHVHQIHSASKEGIKYFNTGSWIEKPSGYITIVGDNVEQHTI
ncbi:MAG: metallophosphoesterase family protein [Candidatus Falkowbacteria bacterium]|nr:metallophosphoesterase family protein [Candidatus Falkowbacteria bacterium]